jgi:hypothetical protein
MVNEALLCFEGRHSSKRPRRRHRAVLAAASAPFLGGPFTMWISWVPRRSRASSKSWRGITANIPAGCSASISWCGEQALLWPPKPWLQAPPRTERRPTATTAVALPGSSMEPPSGRSTACPAPNRSALTHPSLGHHQFRCGYFTNLQLNYEKSSKIMSFISQRQFGAQRLFCTTGCEIVLWEMA